LARVRLSGRLFALALAGLLAPGCHMFRSAEADRTVWNELPSDPRPELWAEGEPRIAVVFEGAYRALGDAPPSFDPNATEYYRRKLRRAGAFTQVLKRDHAEAGGLPVVRMQRSFREDDHTVANLSQALTIPGVLGYRFGLVATLTLELTRPDARRLRSPQLARPHLPLRQQPRQRAPPGLFRGGSGQHRSHPAPAPRRPGSLRGRAVARALRHAR
jgi:hypothetical protein